MAELSPRADALFNRPTPHVSRAERESMALARLARAGCPPFPAFVDCLATYAGGTFTVEGGDGVTELCFSDLTHHLLLTRFGDLEVHDPAWLVRCRPETLPGGRDPDDWDLHVGGDDFGTEPGLWSEGTVRKYYGGFSWSRPLADTLEGYLEAKALIADAVLGGYVSAFAAVAGPAVAVELATRYGLRPDPFASSTRRPGSRTPCGG